MSRNKVFLIPIILLFTSHNRLFLSTILLLSSLCLGIASCVFAPSIVWSIRGDPEDTEQTWRKLPPPPEKVKEIISAHYWTVYVRTMNGKILSCYRESKLDVKCWSEVKQMPKVEKDWNCNGCWFADPPKSINVVQEYQIDYPDGRDTDTRSAFSYLLDRDGQVWQWGFERFLYFGPPEVIRISLKASLIGLSTGSIVPFLLLILLWRKVLLSPFRKKQQTDENNN